MEWTLPNRSNRTIEEEWKRRRDRHLGLPYVLLPDQTKECLPRWAIMLARRARKQQPRRKILAHVIEGELPMVWIAGLHSGVGGAELKAAIP